MSTDNNVGKTLHLVPNATNNFELDVNNDNDADFELFIRNTYSTTSGVVNENAHISLRAVNSGSERIFVTRSFTGDEGVFEFQTADKVGDATSNYELVSSFPLQQATGSISYSSGFISIFWPIDSRPDR